MPADPSGRYKGSNWDPLYFQKKELERAGGPPAFSSDSNSANANSTGRNRQNGYMNHYGSGAPTTAPVYPSRPTGESGRNDQGYNGRKSPRSPSPTKRNGAPTPTGPASMNKSHLPAKPSLWAVASARRSGNESLEMDTSSGSSDYKTAPENSIKEEGNVSTQSTTSPSLKVHPSRLGLVPQPSPGVSSPLNPARTPVSASTDTPSRDASTYKSSRPAPLNLTPAATPNEQVKTPAMPHWSPSLISSPATKSPLDSLDKLRRFKEQVAASRKSGKTMSDLEMSKLAKVAETFLKSQDQDASDQAYAELQKMTGYTDPEPDVPSASAGPSEIQAVSAPTPAAVLPTGPSRGNTTPIEHPETAASRAAMLKERLLASKRGGYSPNTREGQPKPAENGTSGPNGPTGVKRPIENDRPEENEEQKRHRAAIWAHQKPAEPTKKSQQGVHPVRQGPEREEGEWEEARATPAQGYRMERKLSLHDRISERPRRVSNAHRGYSRSPERAHDRHRRDDRNGGRGSYAPPERRDPPQAVPPPQAPSRQGYAPTRPARPRAEDHYQSGPSGSGPAPARAPDPAHAVKCESDVDAAYEARRLARLANLHSSPSRSSEVSRAYQPAPPPPPPGPERTYARAAAEPRERDRDSRYPREDPYARPAEYRRPHEHPTPAPAPVPTPAVAVAQPVIDPATVLATLDLLKAQIAGLERLLPAALPAMAAPAAPPPITTSSYGYERDPYYAHPPHPAPLPAPYAPAPLHAHRHDCEHAHPRDPRRPLSPPTPPPPPAEPYRGYAPPPPPRAPHGRSSPSREVHHRITSDSTSHRGGPYRSERGGYKGRDEYHDRRSSDYGASSRGSGRGFGRGGSGARGRGGGGGRRGGSSRGEGRGRGSSRGR